MRLRLFGIALLALPLAASLTLFTAHSEPAVKIDPPAQDATAGQGLQTAVLAGGCFWGIQAVYQHTKGVTNAVSGYAGGDKADANYKAVSAGATKHAEVVRITFDPKVISYGKILQIYFSVAHNPTCLLYTSPSPRDRQKSRMPSSA